MLELHVRPCVAALLILAACASSAPPVEKTSTGARASCSRDADCVIETQRGCCGACEQEPFAVPVLASEQRRNRCAVVECAAASDRITCPQVEPASRFVAECRAGTCIAARR